MAEKKEKPEDKVEGTPVATAFQSVSAPAQLDFGTKSLWVSGTLVAAATNAGVGDTEVTVALAGTPVKTDTETTASGKFTTSLDTSTLKVGSYDLTFSYEGEAGKFDPAESTQPLTVDPVKLTIAGVIVDDKEYDGTTKATIHLPNHKLVGAPDGAHVELEAKHVEASFADNNAGVNKPVTVKGLALGGKDKDHCTLVLPELTATIRPKPLTVTGVVAKEKAADGTTEARLAFDKATLSGVLVDDDVQLDTSKAEGAFEDQAPGSNKKVAVSGVSLAGPAAGNYIPIQPTTTASITAAKAAPARSEPGNSLGSALKRVLQDPKVNAGVAQMVREASSQLSGGKGVDQQTVKKMLDGVANAMAGTDAVKAKCEPCNGQMRLQVRRVDANTKDWKDAERVDDEVLRELARQVRLVNDKFEVVSGQPIVDRDSLLFDRVSVGTVNVAWSVGIAFSDVYFAKTPKDQDFQCYVTTGGKKLTAAYQRSLAAAGSKQIKLTQMSRFQTEIHAGQCTDFWNFVEPDLANVRCFCRLTEDGCCSGGKEFIESVCVTARRGEIDHGSLATGPDGSSEFELPPGWYTFSAPDEITICGCNYELCCGSPISAYVGPGQSCSDIVFSYKKAGNEILLDALICHPDIDDPDQKVAPENFPGMQYLLLRDCDQTFVEQQTSTDGSAVRFCHLPAGTYSIFCQAPALWGTNPVKPVNPAGGHMTLRVFAGQTNPIPVPVVFHTCDTAPAVLDGYVRDETGQAIAQQLVKVVNRAGCLVAVGVTDTTGLYSIQMYRAEDVAIIVNDQKVEVTKKQIQAAMKQIVKPGPEYAKKLLTGIIDREEIPGLAAAGN